MAKMARNFTAIVYPDESVANFLEVLSSVRVPILVSPIHHAVKDNGEEAKPHRHIMLSFSGKKSVDSMNHIHDYLVSQGVALTQFQNVTDKLAMESYFIHKGYPEKEQFEYKDLTALCGYKLNYSDEDTDYTLDILAWCNSAGCYSFPDVVDYAIWFMPEWIDTLMGRRAYAINKYLESCNLRVKTSFVRKDVVLNDD